jgi:DNA replication initiation complex subunit (GINS family)
LPENPILDASFEIQRGLGQFRKLHQFIKELWKRLHDYISPGDISWDEFKNVVIETINAVSASFADEKEWIVKNAILNVPKGSLLAFDEDEMTVYASSKQIIGLEKQYNLVEMDDLKKLDPKKFPFI